IQSEPASFWTPSRWAWSPPRTLTGNTSGGLWSALPWMLTAVRSRRPAPRSASVRKTRAERTAAPSSRSPTPHDMGSRLAITSSDSSLEQAWFALRAGGRQALIPYLTAGYPSPEASVEALQAAAEVSDMLVVGVPFSDPLADGPTIQRSTFEALRQGMTLPRTLDLIARADLSRPVIIFSYLNPILRYGVERFL